MFEEKFYLWKQNFVLAIWKDDKICYTGENEALSPSMMIIQLLKAYSGVGLIGHWYR